MKAPTEKKIDLHIGVGRIGNKIVLEMDDASAGWLILQLIAPLDEGHRKRAELAELLRRATQ